MFSRTCRNANEPNPTDTLIITGCYIESVGVNRLFKMADVEPETKALNEMDEEISMSRGMRAEVKVNFDKCRDMFVYDQMGNKIRFGDVYKKQKTIVVFTRVSSTRTWQYLCLMTRCYRDASS